jgi:Ferritin-like domain
VADKNVITIASVDEMLSGRTRREFLRIMGVGGAAVLLPSVFAACNNNDDNNGITNPPPSSAVVLNLSNDTGILNYAYALEQLEAAYYTAVLTSAGFAGLNANEQEIITDLQKHEVIHREFFKQVLGTAAIGTLAFNPTTVAALSKDFTTILSTSQLLEDTGVSAYNGAGKYLTVAANLVVAGKIVSVEARHAAAIRDARDIRAGNTGKAFAGDDTVNAAGLDVKNEPMNVIAAVGGLNVLSTTTPVSIGTQPPTKSGTDNMPAPTPA